MKHKPNIFNAHVSFMVRPNYEGLVNSCTYFRTDTNVDVDALTLNDYKNKMNYLHLERLELRLGFPSGIHVQHFNGNITMPVTPTNENCCLQNDNKTHTNILSMSKINRMF